jgi:phospholipid/cholesterol/gamma-HCH transport system substrate-binding protein
MKFIVILTLSLFSLKSCLTDGTTINVVMDDAAGLERGSKVKCKGLEVGKVNDIKIVGNKVIASVKLMEDFQPTKGSTAQVNLENLFNDRNLTILPSESTEILANGDTIYAQSNVSLDIIKSIFKNSDIDSLTGELSLDSLSSNLIADSAKISKLMRDAGKILDLNKLLK